MSYCPSGQASRLQKGPIIITRLSAAYQELPNSTLNTTSSKLPNMGNILLTLGLTMTTSSTFRGTFGFRRLQVCQALLPRSTACCL